ncbi:auxin efflux carrier component 5 [Impatiens glandulifera]|uniref:auxin efflux carrier component 5 n=1 Tax=Impatiens glandulifera TaxID=253017 RepID=UPI001FB04BF9|nr:auxin efflux carrier component 5 [Impatiens glandulifera]
MIGWEDVYKVVEAMVPLYMALMMGYGSIKWWRLITPEQCDAINRLVCYFTLPLFTLDFTIHVNPYKLNYRFLYADIISKVVILFVLAIWAKFSSKGSYCWSITSFSLSTLTNALVVGVPLMRAMYGNLGVDLVVQASVIQAIVWLTFLLFVLEFRRSGNDMIAAAVVVEDLEGNVASSKTAVSVPSSKFCSLMKVVGLKLAANPNSYACIIGIAWAFVSIRWNLKTPGIVDGSIKIMSKAGTGTAMFSLGLFMAVQGKVIACGPSLTIFGMVLRFIAGPAAMAIGAIAVGLHGDVLRVAIIQAALPQSITSFIYAKEYGLHAEVLSTA